MDSLHLELVSRIFSFMKILGYRIYIVFLLCFPKYFKDINWVFQAFSSVTPQCIQLCMKYSCKSMTSQTHQAIITNLDIFGYRGAVSKKEINMLRMLDLKLSNLHYLKQQDFYICDKVFRFRKSPIHYLWCNLKMNVKDTYYRVLLVILTSLTTKDENVNYLQMNLHTNFDIPHNSKVCKGYEFKPKDFNNYIHIINQIVDGNHLWNVDSFIILLKLNYPFEKIKILLQNMDSNKDGFYTVTDKKSTYYRLFFVLCDMIYKMLNRPSFHDDLIINLKFLYEKAEPGDVFTEVHYNMLYE